MSRGKYSPCLPHHCTTKFPDDYRFNCYGKEPTPWTLELQEAGGVYDEKTMFGNYDSEGFDRYSYSAFDADGNYCFGSGIDRLGNTENEYLAMSDEDFFAI